MKKIISRLIPPERWRLPVAIALGIFCGLGIYTIRISNAVSYLSDSPKTCVNCHVMNPQYATWSHSSHRETATCNDCHVPHNNVFNKYFFKAKDGMRHATIFTLRNEPEVIQIKDASKAVVQENCKRCHNYLNKNVNTIHVTTEASKQGAGHICWECHRETPHGTVNSLSASPYARIPENENPVPEWLEKLVGH